MRHELCWRVRVAIALSLLTLATLLCLVAAVIPVIRSYGDQPFVENTLWRVVHHELGFGDFPTHERFKHYRVVAAGLAVPGFLCFCAGFLLLGRRGHVNLYSPRAVCPARRIALTGHLGLIAGLVVAFAYGLSTQSLWSWLAGIGIILIYAILLDGVILTYTAVRRWLPVLAYVGGLLLLSGCYLYLKLSAWTSAAVAGMAAAGLLALAGTCCPRRRFELLVLGMISFGGFVLAVWDIAAWHYAVIGDEYAFLYGAREILKEHTRNFLGNIAYEYHPAASTYFHALSMRLFGEDVNGWKAAGGFQLLVSALALYSFARGLFGVPVAMAVALLLATSGYAQAVMRCGYNNFEALMIVCVLLAATAGAARRATRLNFVLLGFAAGWCFHTFPIARLAPMIVLGWFIIRLPPTNWRRCSAWLTAGLAGLVVAWPHLLNADTWQAMLQHGPALQVRSQDEFGSYRNLFNMLEGCLLAIDSQRSSHHFSGPHLWIVPNVLVIAGLASFVTGAARRRTAAFILLMFLPLVPVLAALHPYDYPPNTRMHLALPAWFIVAGLGLASVTQVIARALRTVPSAVAWIALGILAPLLFVGETYATQLRKLLAEPCNEEVQIYAGMVLKKQFGHDAGLLVPCDLSWLCGQAVVAHQPYVPEINFLYTLEGADESVAVLEANRNRPAILAINPLEKFAQNLALAREVWQEQGMELAVYWRSNDTLVSYWVVSPAVAELKVDVPPQLVFRLVPGRD